MFWITKSGPVSSTWISLGPAILCNTHENGDFTQEEISLDADTIHNNQQMMRLVVERISAFSGFGLALAGGLGLGGLEGVAVQSRPSTFAIGHRSLSRTTIPTQPA